MKKLSEFKYTDFFDPKDLSIANCWMVIEGALRKKRDLRPAQIDDMKKAFYIGFTEAFKIITDLSEVLTEEHACDVLTRISKEANEFHDKTIEELR